MPPDGYPAFQYLQSVRVRNPKPQRRGVEQKTRIMPRLFSGDSLIVVARRLVCGKAVCLDRED